ncbi:MAG: ABC transporter permease [Elusimicrobia bacterium]|nr:ABC transporter permease [Elusimicrobiota bacterium]
MTRLWLAIATGLREIRANKLRSVLSFAAVAVGSASVLYTLAGVTGMSREVRAAIDLLGPGRLRVEAKRGYKSRGLSPGLTSEDASEIAKIPGVFMAYPKTQGWGVDVRYRGQKFDGVQVVGTTPAWAKRDWVYRLRGRFFNDGDVRENARVCVVLEPGGWEVKPFWYSFWGRERPFPAMVSRRDLLGRELQLNGHGFTVVGVIREPPRDRDPRWFSREWTGGGYILTPVSAHHEFLRPKWQSRPGAVNVISVDTGDERTIPQVKRAIEVILHRRHRGEQDYDIIDYREEIANELEETRGQVLVGVLLGGVAILAGGIGIMNVTLATIFARVKEIGIRRALGASRLDIVGQFVAEATLLGVMGGLAGLVLGTFGVEYLMKSADRDMAQLVWWHLPAALAVAAATGFLFSVGPAWRASGLDPVDSLRNE